METILIQLTHHKALKLLLDLEELRLIRVLKKNVQPDQGLSNKYAGKLSQHVTNSLQDHISQSREEWTKDM